MKNYQNNYLSEFEQEFELDSESTDSYNEFETVNDEFESEGEYETFDSEGDFESNDENNYLSEFETDNEFEVDNEFEDTPEGRFEARLYELFTNNYESDFEFENDFNEIMHEMERDYFWGGLKKKLGGLAKKGLSAGLKALPIEDKWKKMIGGLAKGQLPSMSSLIKTLGPKLAQFIPGVGPIASTAMGAMMNSEVSPQNQAKQAAQNTVALAKQTYSNFANGLANKVAPSNNINQLRGQVQNVAQNAIKSAHNTVRLGSTKYRYVRVNRKVEDTTVQGKPGKKVTIWYKRA